MDFAMSHDRTIADWLCDRIEQIEGRLAGGGLVDEEILWRQEEVKAIKVILRSLGREELREVAAQEGQ
jgi:hypothetical protein